jgi:hypothetical protein
MTGARDFTLAGDKHSILVSDVKKLGCLYVASLIQASTPYGVPLSVLTPNLTREY